MAIKRRPEEEFQSTPDQPGPQLVTLAGFNGGVNGYSNPELLSPQFWAQASNAYSGQHGGVRRARFAPVANTSYFGTTGTRITSMFSFAPPFATSPFLIMENGNLTQTTFGPITILRYGAGSGAIYNESPTVSPSLLLGPYMRFAVNPIMVIQANGLVRSKLVFNSGFPNGLVDWEFWGLDSPDSSPQITLSAGTTGNIVAATGASRTSNIVTITLTAALPANLIPGAFVNIAGVTDTSFNSPVGTAFQVISTATPSFTYFQVGANATSGSGTATVQITKNVGRSYAWAWENAITGHISAPSPASQYVAYANQTGTIDLVQPGTVTTNIGSPIITGTNTAFTSAWIGRQMWVETVGNIGSTIGLGYIASVQSSTQLTLNVNAIANTVNQRFQIFDEFQATNVRLYETGDGGSVYFRTARNNFAQAATITAAGLRFIDTANSEPPNAPFTSEIAQAFNIPPPIGDALFDYQGRIGVYGVPGALQSFFYSNIEATVVGQPPESFAPLNQVTLPVGESRLNGTANLPTGLIIWSSKQDMFKLTGLLSDNTVSNQFQLGATIQKLPYKIGCASRFGTAVTPLGAIWFSSDREVQLFTDHYAPKNVGRPIQNVLSQATRINFARAKYYKAQDRNWFCLAITVGNGTFNNKLCILDLDLLSSNGQASYFTFDMATNQPSWYLYDVNCESIEAAIDSISTNHLLTGDVDTVTDIDWQPAYYTVGVEQPILNGSMTLHALGNEAPQMIKTMEWIRCNTNQLPQNINSPAQRWKWNILAYDDDKYVLGINPQTISLTPGTDSQSNVAALEYSPAKFVLGSTRSVKGRRFQVQTVFPTQPGFWELRSFQIFYTNVSAK